MSSNCLDDCILLCNMIQSKYNEDIKQISEALDGDLKEVYLKVAQEERQQMEAIKNFVYSNK